LILKLILNFLKFPSLSLNVKVYYRLKLYFINLFCRNLLYIKLNFSKKRELIKGGFSLEIELGSRTYSINKPYFSMSSANIVNYFNSLNVAFHDLASLFGFMVFLIIANQLISGTMLSFSLITEPMLIPLDREEEDLENIYIDDFFWLHERGVDLIFIFVFLHLFRKLYLNTPNLEKDYAWKSGVFAFLIIQLTVFLGLVLCCTHLSDVTLTIAKNAVRTFLLFIGKIEWLILTDGMLNSDTVVRLCYAHYVVAFFLAFLGLSHGIDMHYDWQANPHYDGIKQDLSWNDEVLRNEIGKTFDFLVVLWCLCLLMYTSAEPLSFEYFMWGDIGMVTDVRFYSVAPHWYFRPYMAWLIACPYHYLGIFGLVFFFVVFFFQLNIIGHNETGSSKKLKTVSFISLLLNGKSLYTLQWEKIEIESNLQWQLTFAMFIIAIAYTCSYLPYGRFYHSIGGNFMTLFSYLYIFSFLGFTFIRYSWTISSTKLNTAN
jgi:quinol-cytochrome oxidoreductase complex cytochrome b subunit